MKKQFTRKFLPMLLAAAIVFGIIPGNALTATENGTNTGNYDITTVLEPSLDFRDAQGYGDAYYLGNFMVSRGYYDTDWNRYRDVYDGRTGELLFENAEMVHGVKDWDMNWRSYGEESNVVAVKHNDQWYLIDQAGTITATPAQFYDFGWDDDHDDPVGFSEGLAAVCVWDETKPSGTGTDVYYTQRKYGFINEDGELVIDFEYDWVEPFYGGIAIAEIYGDWEYNEYTYNDYTYGYWSYNSSTFGILTKEGEFTVLGEANYSTPNYFYAYNCKNGFVAASNNDNKYGIFNSNGELTVPFEYDYIESYDVSDGLFLVQKGGYYSGAERKYGFINGQGEVAVPVEYDDYRMFGEGLAAVCKNNKWGFVNTKGEVVVPLEYDFVPYSWYTAGNFKDGFAAVRVGNNSTGKWGFVNAEGELAIPTVYDNVYPFYEGLSMVCKGGKWGFINTQGETVVPFEYDTAYNFKDGFAAVCKDNKYGFVNTKGEITVPIEYDFTLDFNNGFAYVQKDGKSGIINTKGEITVPLEYSSIGNDSENYYYYERGTEPEIFTNGLAIARVLSGNKYGVIDNTGDVIIPLEYQDVKFIGAEDDTSYYWLKDNELWGIFAITKNTLSIPSIPSDNPNFIAPVEPISDTSDWISISNRAELESINNNLDGKYYLTNDIDLDGEEWTPLGIKLVDGKLISHSFMGTFDGQGYVIRNLTNTTVKITRGGNYGLFGMIESAEIKNVGIENTYIDVSSRGWCNAGGIAGFSNDNSYYGRTSEISNCYTTGSIKVDVPIPDDGDADADAGGIIGFGFHVNISNCYNEADIYAQSIYDYVNAGGIIGSGGENNIENCYNTGNVTSSSDNNHNGRSGAGGIVGYIENSIIKNCYNTGAVSSEYASGGIAGNISGTVTDCYNAGTVTSDSYAGGIVGIDYNDDCVFENCYWEIGSAGKAVGNNEKELTALTTAQMRQQSSFVGFDFDTVWTIIEGVNDGMPTFKMFGIDPKPPVTTETTPVTTEPPTTDTGSATDITTTSPDITTSPPTTTTPDYTSTPPTTTTPPPSFTLGDVDNDGEITIFDALEILKDLVGMESLATGNPSALITPDSKQRGEPSIFDALEILKYLVRMDNFIEHAVRGLPRTNDW